MSNLTKSQTRPRERSYNTQCVYTWLVTCHTFKQRLLKHSSVAYLRQLQRLCMVIQHIYALLLYLYIYIECMQYYCMHILPRVSKFNFTNLYTVNLCNCVHAFLLHIHAFMCVMKLHTFMQVLLISQCLSFQHIEMENT